MEDQKSRDCRRARIMFRADMDCHTDLCNWPGRVSGDSHSHEGPA
jgi:hypothetical protein